MANDQNVPEAIRLLMSMQADGGQAGSNDMFMRGVNRDIHRRGGPPMHAPHMLNNRERRENDRVNRMSEQEFENYMNDLHIRDSVKPIKADLLSQLPRSRYQATGLEGPQTNVNQDERQCTICMTDFEQGEEILTLTCFHKYHSECVETWFKSQNWCPVCRTIIAD